MPPISRSLLPLHELRSWKITEASTEHFSAKKCVLWSSLRIKSTFESRGSHGHQSNTRILLENRSVIIKNDRITSAKYSLVHGCTWNSSSVLRLVREFSLSIFLAGFSSTKNDSSSLSIIFWNEFPLFVWSSRWDTVFIQEIWGKFACTCSPNSSANFRWRPRPSRLRATRPARQTSVFPSLTMQHACRPMRFLPAYKSIMATFSFSGICGIQLEKSHTRCIIPPITSWRRQVNWFKRSPHARRSLW